MQSSSHKHGKSYVMVSDIINDFLSFPSRTAEVSFGPQGWFNGVLEVKNLVVKPYSYKPDETVV